MLISQPKTSFLGVGFDGDHDFEGPRVPKAHLDTVNTNLSHQVAPPEQVGALWFDKSNQIEEMKSARGATSSGLMPPSPTSVMPTRFRQPSFPDELPHGKSACYTACGHDHDIDLKLGNLLINVSLRASCCLDQPTHHRTPCRAHRCPSM